MPRYHVFLPPPSPESLRSAAKRQWLRGEIALEHESEARVMEDTKLDEDSQIYWDEFSSISSWGALGYGPMGGESVQLASQRLSTLYEGVVFRESCEDEYTQSQSQVLGSQASERETSFEWSRTQHSIELVPSISGQPPPNSSPQRSQSQFLTSLEESSYSTSPSVIHQLPKFRVPLLSLSPLHAISNGTINTEDSNSKKVSILVAVLDVDGPEYVRITKGVDRGIEVGLLKLVLGSVDGSICRLTVWRERAELWGNLTRRGDVVLFQDILYTRQKDGSPSLTASSNLNSKATVCYRTLPILESDQALRPDLRLAAIDPGIASVAKIAEWIQTVVHMG